MKIGLIKERKNPPDRRVVFSPNHLKTLKANFPELNIVVEKSPIRVFSDSSYEEAGFDVVDDVSDCDVLLGVKEVPIDALIPNKKYFFFSHTIKKQPYNKKLLQAILEKNITLFDHETLTDESNRRIVGFGRYAGIVGAYNGLRGFGQKFELFNIPKASTLADQAALVKELKKHTFPPIKIVLTGSGKVAYGAKEILDALKFKQVSSDDFLNKNYSQPVFTQIDVLDYNKRKDGKVLDNHDFYSHPEAYESDFEKYTKVSDMFIAGHFYGDNAPVILSRTMLQSPTNKIQVVADISCDIDGPVACTLKASTIAEPFFGYSASKHQEVSFNDADAILVMSVDNLPCELPKDASEGFGVMFGEAVIPAFFNNDADGILKRAQITDNGKLTPRFEYLTDYVKSN
uniref:NAD(P)-dependent oxidoreductase n=1 Tax=Flavobacterium sp. TaxID=239 RepID=UPI00404A41CE